MPLPRGSEDRGVGIAGLSWERDSAEHGSEAELAHSLKGIFSLLGVVPLGAASSGLCCLESQLLPGHWDRAGHCSEASEGRNCVLPGGVLFCRGAELLQGHPVRVLMLLRRKDSWLLRSLIFIKK